MLTASSNQPGPWIRILLVSCSPSNDRNEERNLFWDDVNVLVLAATNLQTAQVDHLELRASVLTTVGAIAPGSLRDLLCHLGNRSTSALHVIGRFRALRTLTLYLTSETKPDFEGVRPWTIPTLLVFVWLWAGPVDDVSLRLLASCRFEPSCKIILSLFELRQAQSIILDPFFTSHARSKRLRVSTRIPVHPSSKVLTASDVEFGLSLPPPSLFEQDKLPARILFASNVERYLIDLPPILDVLEARTKTESTVVLRIALAPQLNDPLGTGFRWQRKAGVDVSPQHAQFAGLLLSYALRLYSVGVIIVDQEGEDLAAYIQKGKAKRETRRVGDE
jgi:hypothetical protein